MLTKYLTRVEKPKSEFNFREPSWRSYLEEVFDLSYDILGERRLKQCLRKYEGG
jgi:hypothetical protein